MLLPIENLFISFKLPNSVLSYYQCGTVNDIVYGKNSCMIIYSEKNTFGGQFIVPKSEKGYKIPSLFSVKRIFYSIDENGTFEVYNVSGTKDYYSCGMISLKEEANIVDQNHKKINTIITEIPETNIKNVIFYSFVENFTNDYFIAINGRKIIFS